MKPMSYIRATFSALVFDAVILLSSLIRHMILAESPYNPHTTAVEMWIALSFGACVFGALGLLWFVRSGSYQTWRNNQTWKKLALSQPVQKKSTISRH